jgi:uncharacterized membrane protein YfcA
MNISYFILIFILSLFQSIFGIGLLALGTPLLLLNNFSFEQTLSILLPCSMLVSIITLFFARGKFKESLDYEFIKNFFIFCLPSVMLGFLFIFLFQLHINLKLMIGFLILISVILSLSISNKIFPIINSNKKIINFIIGFIHGISNVGGAFLSNYLLILNKNEKIKTRIQIAFAYFFFGFTQYFFLQFLLNNFKNLNNIYTLLLIATLGVIAGNGMQKYFKNIIFKYIINGSITISALFLIFKSLN